MGIYDLRLKSPILWGYNLLGLFLILFLAGCTLTPVVPAAPQRARTITPPAENTAPVQDTVSTTGQGIATTTSPDIPPGRIRRSAVAGSWYPDDPEQLAGLVDAFLATVKPVDGQPLGLIVPHAGYLFSGPVAAYGFKQLAGTAYEVAVIIAADHRPPLSAPISVWAEGGFETPLGVVPVDVELAEALIAADPRITYDLAPHEGEHPIEIELPFLQRVCPECRIVPILMAADDEETVQALAEALLSVLGDRRTVVIASSDLAHYPTQADALRVDGVTLAAIETGDPGLIRTTIAASMSAGIPNLATCACGQGPILVTMRVAAGLGADRISILRYANSADSPYGNADQVVGYGAVMLWHYEPPDLSGTRQQQLLALARTTITEYLETEQISDYVTDDPVLTRRSGAFVTLKKEKELHGCIGRVWADTPLSQVIQQLAVAAATSDPRFPPLTAEELDDVNLEISVLSPLRRVTDLEQIQVGVHGLMILQSGQQGVLLPQAPVEQGWNREEFLENLCLKAGLPADCWLDQPTLYSFTAVVFGE